MTTGRRDDGPARCLSPSFSARPERKGADGRREILGKAANSRVGRGQYLCPLPPTVIIPLFFSLLFPPSVFSLAFFSSFHPDWYHRRNPCCVRTFLLVFPFGARMLPTRVLPANTASRPILADRLCLCFHHRRTVFSRPLATVPFYILITPFGRPGPRFATLFTGKNETRRFRPSIHRVWPAADDIYVPMNFNRSTAG